MEIQVQTQMNSSSYIFKIEEKDTKEALLMASVFGNPPRYCHECKNSDPDAFNFDANKDKDGNVYNNVRCLKCGAKANLGSYKSGGFFWKKFEKWQPKEKKIEWDD